MFQVITVFECLSAVLYKLKCMDTFVMYTENNIWMMWFVNFRVFSDRLVNHSDMDTFISLLEEKLGSLFDLTFHSICPNKQLPIFGT